MSPLARWGIPAAIGLAALSAWLWHDRAQSDGDPTYAQEPTLWAGAPGQTAGLHGPMGLPALAASATSALRTADALALVGRSFADLQRLLGQPARFEADGGQAVAVWTSAVTVDQPPPDGHPVAHLRIGLHGAGDTAVVREVAVIGSVGFVLASTTDQPARKP